MGTHDKTPFEIIRASSQGERATETPSWWDSQPSGRGGGGGFIAWATEPVRVRISRLAVAIIAIVCLAGVGVAYELGARSKAVAPGEVADARSAELLARLRMEPAREELADAASERGGAAERSVGKGPGDRGPDGRVDATDRVPGLNYFCVMTLKTSHRDNAERVAGFLRKNGVPAAVIETGSGYLQILALRGFERASSPQAVDFKKKLTTLGRSWKAQGGARDWSSAYAIKYDPDR